MATSDTARVTENAGAAGGIALPDDLARRLAAFRGLVWRIKLLEAFAGAACGILLGYLAVFAVDRLTDTPWWVRVAAFVGAVAACTVVPLALHRWVWNHRALDQVARLIARRFPSMGDQILGIIEIVRSAAEGRDAAGGLGSRRLCEAAIAQVAERSRQYDFATAVPRPRHRLWLAVAALPVAAALIAAAVVPPAAANAWARFLAPWQAIERFTFARVGDVPRQIVVPRGEPAALDIELASDTRTRPVTARARIGGQPLAADLAADRYAFTLPPQLTDAPLKVAVGDARVRSQIVPMLRPEITEVMAEVRLPDYLQRPTPVRTDVRAGVLAPVKGSTVSLEAKASRDLEAARVDGDAIEPAGAVIRTQPVVVSEETRLALEWRDTHGLEGSKPLVVQMTPRADEAPALALQGLPPSRDMLLSSDTLKFTIAVVDDFGIRRVGIEWQGEGGADGGPGDRGERPLKAGGPEQAALDVAATFCPDALGVRPQPLAIRAYAEDYFPGRGRVYSAPFYVYVVDRAEHALVVNERLSRWRRQASEIRDREMALLATNMELRQTPSEKLLDADTRRRIEQQVAAENSQQQRMDRLVDDGGKLVREAMKNPEFDAQTLERLAQDIQTLADIGDNRMPGVADMLKAAANAKLASAAERDQAGKAGESQDGQAGKQAANGQAGQESKGGEPGKQGDTPGQPAASELAGNQGGESGKPSEGQAGKPSEGQAGKPSEGQAGKQGGESGQPKPSELAMQSPSKSGEPGKSGGSEGEAGQPGEQAPKVGEERSQGAGGESSSPSSPAPPVPHVADVESSQQPQGEKEQGDQGEKKNGPPSPPTPGRFGLPSTTAGVSPPAPPKPPQHEDEEPPAAEEALAAAIEAQQKLLEEFAKVAEDLARVMASLEGSTFVKRLKLASREQGEIAGQIAAFTTDVFGGQKPPQARGPERVPGRRPGMRVQPQPQPQPQEAVVGQPVRDVSAAEARQAEKLSNIMDDLQAYLERRQLPAFRTVLEEMKGLDALGSIRQLSEDVKKEAGMSLAQAEFWSDTFDRLADDLVEAAPPAGGEGSGASGPPPASVPPEVVLETMLILEAEMNLREETRVAEQAKDAVQASEHEAGARKLADAQDALADRVVGMIDTLIEVENGEQEYAREIQLFERVEEVMAETSGILKSPDTGPKAIGAETEIIELLLVAQAASGGGGGGGGGGSGRAGSAGGGGGGGTSPGGGGTGTTSTSALALVGSGNRGRGAGDGGERRQSTGVSGRVLPEEFRAGLDAYFNQFERGRQ
jgi:uncharacterized membrane protein YgcG